MLPPRPVTAPVVGLRCCRTPVSHAANVPRLRGAGPWKVTPAAVRPPSVRARLDPEPPALDGRAWSAPGPARNFRVVDVVVDNGPPAAETPPVEAGSGSQRRCATHSLQMLFLGIRLFFSAFPSAALMLGQQADFSRFHWGARFCTATAPRRSLQLSSLPGRRTLPKTPTVPLVCYSPELRTLTPPPEAHPHPGPRYITQRQCSGTPSCLSRPVDLELANPPTPQTKPLERFRTPQLLILLAAQAQITRPLSISPQTTSPWRDRRRL